MFNKTARKYSTEQHEPINNYVNKVHQTNILQNKYYGMLENEWRDRIDSLGLKYFDNLEVEEGARYEGMNIQF